MSEDEYNGWTNRETWAVALHINNDQGWQESVYEALREFQARREAVPADVRAQTEAGERGAAYLAYLAGEIIRENVEETLEPMEDSDLRSFHGSVILTQGQWIAIQDIGSLWRVDWTELGASFLEGLSENDRPSEAREADAPLPSLDALKDES